jgi:hypothetical protein
MSSLHVRSGSLEAEPVEKLDSETSGSSKVDFGHIDLFEFVQLQLNPVFDVLQTPHPAIEIVLVQHLGRLERKTASSMLVNALFAKQGVIIGCIDADDRREIIEGPHQRSRSPMTAQDWKDAGIENYFYSLVRQLPAGFGLSPEIDANRHADLSKIGGKNPKYPISP